MEYFMRNNEVQNLKAVYPVNTRIRLVKMDDIQAPPAGTCGTIRYIDDAGIIHVNWDTGSSLGIIYGTDEFVKIEN